MLAYQRSPLFKKGGPGGISDWYGTRFFDSKIFITMAIKIKKGSNVEPAYLDAN